MKILGIYTIFNITASLLLKINRAVGNLYTKMYGLFGIAWFNHWFDYLLGPDNWYWCERGVFGNRVIKFTDTVLDLCCGDGIYSGLFYSTKAASVDAIDKDKRAISFAKRRYSKPNVRFFIRDVNNEIFPKTDYNVVCFFAAIEHFSVEAGIRLLQKIAVSLQYNDGILIGSTPILLHKGGHNPEHDNEFLSIEQIKFFLRFHFTDVTYGCQNGQQEPNVTFNANSRLYFQKRKLYRQFNSIVSFLKEYNTNCSDDNLNEKI